MVLVEVALEVVDGKFISALELAIVVRINLNCVISQMDKPR